MASLNDRLSGGTGLTRAAADPAGACGTPVLAAGAVGATGRPPLLESEALMQGHRTVEIHHQGVFYRLQATRQGKLILTK